jgi:hypothetical protein
MTLLELIHAPQRQAGSLERVDHRPWPLPQGRWLMGQTWEDLLFAHWPVPLPALRALVPGELEVDAHEGQAWISVTPFRVTGVRLRGTLPLPVLSSFLETNVRTYVRHGDRPGIWFFSLDADSAAAVAVARRVYRLPYFRARMRLQSGATAISYSTVRVEPGTLPRTLNARYRPTGSAVEARPGTLEHFLTERFCLYAYADGGLHRADIHHLPWPLQPAAVTITENTMVPGSLGLPDDEPVTHFARRQDVVIWPLEPVS